MNCSHSQTGATYWEGHIAHQGKQWQIAVEFEVRRAGETAVYVDFVEIGGYRRLFSLSRMADNIRFERQQPNGRPPLIFDGTITANSIAGKFEGIGIKGADFSLKPAVKPAFTSEEVTFSNDTVRLSGSLLIPDGKGPFAAVVLTHGSGPDTRSLYYGIAMDFVRNGVAALIYDKRGNGSSTGGDYTAAGFTDLAKDALAGVRLLKANKRIHPAQIGVFGHSQGGWVAPTAAVLSKDVAFVITSAASAVTATEQSVYHRANVMRQEGFDEAAVGRASDIRRRLNAATRLCFTDTAAARESIRSVTEELKAVRNEPWFAASALPEIPYPGCPSASVLELLFKEPTEIWKNVRVPVYAVWGKQDIIVPVDKIHIITDALQRAGNDNVTTRVVPDTDHSFLVIREDKDWDFPRESKGYFSDMARWVRNLYSSYYGALADTILRNGGRKFIESGRAGLRFYYEADPFFNRNIAKLMDDAAASLAHCKKLLQMEDSHPALKIVYFNNREKLWPYVNMAPKGIALPDAYTLLIATNDSIRAYHTHELMHILSWHKFGGYAAAPADWLQEGLSVYADNPCMNYPIHQVAAYLYHTGKIAKLQTLVQQFRTLPDMAAYMQAGSVVQYFIDEYGYGKFQQLWREGVSNFSAITGKSLEAFELSYQGFLLKAYKERPAVNWKLLDEKGCG